MTHGSHEEYFTFVDIYVNRRGDVAICTMECDAGQSTLSEYTVDGDPSTLRRLTDIEVINDAHMPKLRGPQLVFVCIQLPR